LSERSAHPHGDRGHALSLGNVRLSAAQTLVPHTDERVYSLPSVASWPGWDSSRLVKLNRIELLKQDFTRRQAPGGSVAMTWLLRLKNHERKLESIRAEPRLALREFARIAPILLDSVQRSRTLALLGRVSSGEAEHHAGLAYANGVGSAQRGDRAAATRWLTRALALTPPENRALSARIGLELGLVYLGGGDRIAADAVLAQIETREGEASPASADRVLLQALLAKDIGDHHAAKPLYREALARSESALTPSTHVLALVNLAIALEHTAPSESIALCKLASELIDQQRLDPSPHANILNISGYAQVCRGNLQDARVSLSRALEKTAGSDVLLYEARARFNLTIVDELEGNLDRADAALAEIQRLDLDATGEPLKVWAAIRRAWIALERSDPPTATQSLHVAMRKARCHWEAVDTVRMRLAVFDGDYDLARRLLVTLVEGYRSRDDLLVAMTLLLWSAHVEESAGHRARASRFLEEAWEIGSRHGFVIAPSWWSVQIVATGRALAAGTRMAQWAASLYAPTPPTDQRVHFVALTLEGDVVVDGEPLNRDRWRRGGAGRHVLKRYLGLLSAAYPHGLARDQIADCLWPNSDGDRAVNNLYAATSDLRGMLRGIEGVSVVCKDGAYGLSLRGNVRIVAADLVEPTVTEPGNGAPAPAFQT
jgi:tetratricopeptide (TPR) repeat protein